MLPVEHGQMYQDICIAAHFALGDERHCIFDCLRSCGHRLGFA